MNQLERQQRTKKNISLALYSLLLRKPYDEISVSEICEKAGVSRVSFYHYYDKKDDILIQYSDEKFAEFFEDFTKLESLTFDDLILQIFIFLKKYSRELAILRYAKKEEILMNQFYSYCRYIFSNNLTSPLLKDKDNPLRIPFLVGGVFQIIMRWLDEGMVSSPETMAKYVIDIVK